MSKGFMPTIKQKVEKTESNIIEQEGSVDNKLELLKHISHVQSRIKKDISSDFILAKLSDKDKEYTIEMVSNAYFCKKLMDMLAKKHKKYTWDNEKKVWNKTFLDKEEQAVIKTIGESTFDTFMTKIYMISILNRNVPKNYLVRLIAGYDDEDDVAQKPKDEMGKIDKAKSWFQEKLGIESGEWGD